MLFGASDGRGLTRAGGRAALLCACAAAAVAAQPAFALPIENTPADIADMGMSMGRVVVPRRIDDSVLPHDAPAKAPLVQPDPQSGLAPGGSTITGNSGTFDVSVAPAALESVPSAEGRRNDEGGVRGFRNQAAALPPLPAAPSAAQLEQLLVTSQAPPAADVARIEEGAIVLTTVMTSKVAGSLSNAAPAPASASGSVEYAGSTLGCFGAGCILPHRVRLGA